MLPCLRQALLANVNPISDTSSAKTTLATAVLVSTKSQHVSLALAASVIPSANSTESDNTISPTIPDILAESPGLNAALEGRIITLTNVQRVLHLRTEALHAVMRAYFSPTSESVGSVAVAQIAESGEKAGGGNTTYVY